MFEFLSKLFRSDFMPHGHCYFWRPELVWLHVISDAIITLSYYTIPLALVYMVRKRRDLPFHWMFVMFGIFIFGCGTTHLMEIWNVWHGTYRLAGVLKAITAAASIATAFAIFPLVPRALALPSPEQLRAVNSALQSKSKQIETLSADHVNRLEEERQRIAREVHDEASQALVVIKLSLQILARQLPQGRPDLQGDIQNIHHLVDASIGQMKELARSLRPPILDQLGLDEAIEQLCAEQGERSGVNIEFHSDLSMQRLPEAAEIAFYRVAQEGLTNCIRHAKAKNIWLTLGAGKDGFEFQLKDDGHGFDTTRQPMGLGLLGMQERADMLNAKFEVSSSSEVGTTLKFVLPFPVREAHEVQIE